MKTYIKNSGMKRIVIYGKHPTKDFYIAGSGIEDDLFLISYLDLIINYIEVLACE